MRGCVDRVVLPLAILHTCRVELLRRCVCKELSAMGRRRNSYVDARKRAKPRALSCS